MNGHIKLKPLQQLGEVFNINIRPNPLLLYIIVVTLNVNEKGQTWGILLVSNVYSYVHCAPLGLRFIS